MLIEYTIRGRDRMVVRFTATYIVKMYKVKEVKNVFVNV